MIATEVDRRRSSAPLPLGVVRGIERALELREQDELSYAAIAAVMKRYHGIDRGTVWWTKMLRAKGATAKPHGTQDHLRAQLHKIDREVLAALTECPMTVLQLLYRLKMPPGKLDKLDRSLQRLIDAGKVTSTGAGLTRKWSVK